MTLSELRQALPEYARDTKLNISRILSDESNEGLTLQQSYSVALAAAYATKNETVIKAVFSQVSDVLSSEAVNASKAAATIMAMNNVYYRFVHLVSDKFYSRLPANLRMNVMNNPGVEKVDFELISLGVSAINGCGMCMDAHVNEVVKAGISQQGVQSVIRIVAVINAMAQVADIEQLGRAKVAS